MPTPSLLFGMVGDLLVDRAQPLEAFAKVQGILQRCDLLFGNLEAPFTDTPHMAPSGGVPLFPAAHNLDAFAAVGFNILSMANNHIVDAGHAAMLENRARLRAQGVSTCGAGLNLQDARTPAILERNGVRIAVLAYASVFPMGYEARSNVPGLAPMRAYNLWREAIDNYHIPGTPPRIQTVPDETDLANLAQDIASARANADLVFISFHWGDFLRPFHLTDHETRTARWCIDQGADMIIGHHHHALRGIEWYRGKPIFYGLGHFVFDLRLELSAEMQRTFETMPQETLGYAIAPREGWPLLPLHPDTRMTILAWALIDSSGVHEVGFVPCKLTPDGLVHPCKLDSQDGKEVIDYMERCIASQGLNGKLDSESAAFAPSDSVRVISARA